MAEVETEQIEPEAPLNEHPSAPTAAPRGSRREILSRFSPVVKAAFLLRVTAVTAVVASLFSVLIAPGLPGNAAGRFVDVAAHLSSTFAYLLAGLLITLLCTGAFEIAKAGRIGSFSRVIAVGASGLAVALSAPALHERLHPMAGMLLAISAAFAAIVGAWHALQKAHTRAVGAVLLGFAIAGLLRLAAWELAGVAGDRGNQRMYDVSCGIASAAVVIEGLGQLAAAAWLGTRGRLLGRMASNGAIALAFVVTWGAAYGVRPGAAPWQSILHSALAEVAGQPPPLGLRAVATFLATASIFLALVAVLQRRQVAAIISALALALISRGTLDVPLRAMAIAAAGQWVLLTMLDDRSMWKSFAAQREQRLADEGAEPKA